MSQCDDFFEPEGSLSSGFWLAAHVHAVCIGPDVVVLDLVDDAYMCLPGGADQMRLDRHGTVVGATGPSAHLLAEAGLAVAERPGSTARDALPAPATEAFQLPDSLKIRPSDLMALVGAAVVLRRRGRDPAVRDLLTLSGPAGPARSQAPVIRAAAMVARLLPWVPLRGGCLQRSAFLVAYLRQRGLAADWVFGVRTWPFRAHCWVQLDGICLNDDPERLRAYTPIFSR
jgi:hypothetical protein